jgi:acyl-CoA thioester hydrolase
MTSTAEIPIETPFVTIGLTVEPGWIDYNGHMNIAYYVMAFDRSFDRVYAKLGFAPDIMKAANASSFTTELHIAYLRELRVGAPLRVETRLLDFDTKKIHFVQQLFHAEEGFVAAACEWMMLYVDMGTRRVAAMPEEIRHRLARVKAAHAHLPVPSTVGRAISMTSRRPA